MPVVSLLPNQLNALLVENGIETTSKNMLSQLAVIYANCHKRGPQAFLAPHSDLHYIPARESHSSVYVRCIQIFESAFSDDTLKLLERGKKHMHYK